MCGDATTVADDILDCTATSEELGKTAGKVCDLAKSAFTVLKKCSLHGATEHEARRVPKYTNIRSSPHEHAWGEGTAMIERVNVLLLQRTVLKIVVVCLGKDCSVLLLLKQSLSCCFILAV